MSTKIGHRRLNPFKQEISKPKRVGPEHNPWFWNPSRGQFTKAPERFIELLKSEMGEELEVTWNPLTERWQIWSKAPRFQHPICQGWRLLFVHQDANGGYLPLDERVYARLYQASADKHGSAKKYIDRVISEYWRDKERTNERLKQEAIDQAMPFWDHSQIKNIGKGSKFSTYFA